MKSPSPSFFNTRPAKALHRRRPLICFAPISDPRATKDDTLGCDMEIFEQALPFVRDLYFGVTSHLEELDRKIMEASDNWRLDRMSRVDRNVMRLALFEMLYRKDIPPKVSINEAIELGKGFGAQDSGAFINGVLDRIRKRLRKEDAS